MKNSAETLRRATLQRRSERNVSEPAVVVVHGVILQDDIDMVVNEDFALVVGVACSAEKVRQRVRLLMSLKH